MNTTEKDIKYNDGFYNPTLFNTDAATEVVPLILKCFDAKSVIDIGCGVGTWLSVFKNHGLEIFGVDGTLSDARGQFLTEGEFKTHDLTTPLDLNKKFDLAISLEVAEHLPESAADTFVKTMTNASDQIVFSAAIPYQTTGHTNEQWPSYWIEKFEAKGYKSFDLLRPLIWTNDKVDTYYKQNVIVFVKDESCIKLNSYSRQRPLDVVHPIQYYYNMDLLRTDLNVYSSGKIGISGSLKLLLKAISNKFTG